MAGYEMKTLTFFELLNNENNGIVIPRIQRDYAQGRSNESAIRSDFLDAIHKTIEEKDCKLSLDFVYGSVADKTDEENSGKFIPLDGQQRLTTLFLLHIYASWHKGNFREEKETFSRFTYRTRETATDFIAKLVSLETAPPCNVAPSFWFRDQNWFPYSWDEDPTVVSMLVMLDAIAAKFADVATILWDRLVDDKAIFFHFLDKSCIHVVLPPFAACFKSLREYSRKITYVKSGQSCVDGHMSCSLQAGKKPGPQKSILDRQGKHVHI